MTESTAIWDRIAPKYAKQPVSDPASYDYKLSETRRFLTPDARVLEIGCGTGTTAISHSPYAAEIVATDISEGMLGIAREKAVAAGVENVRFEQKAMSQFGGEDGFDMVMAHSLLHLLDDRDTAIRQIFRLVKPGGVFVSSTMCLSDGYGWFRWVGPLARMTGLAPLVRMFSADELRYSMEKAGFSIEVDWQPNRKKALFLVARRPA